MSYVRSEMETRDDRPTEDHIVQIDGATWADYERLLEVRGDRSAPRITYLEGTLEIMSPSRDHARIKSFIGRLVEAYCLHAEIRFSPFGSWTLKERAHERGAEPDECYVFGDQDATRPHLAIEVIWTWGRLDKLGIYGKLGVREVWVWRKGHIQPYALRGESYEPSERSEALPDLDLELLAQFLDRPTAYDAIRDFTAALVAVGAVDRSR
ncbi:MAG TPA: Uma2 family endonuclease [Kofleriaceae bacterium]|nr:Uma2 family endonuclease [Kofleriaceae bacterium]